MKKKMMWIFLLILIIVVASTIIFLLQRPSPEHSANYLFKTFKAQDHENMRRVYTADIFPLMQKELDKAVERGIDSSIGMHIGTSDYSIEQENDMKETGDLPDVQAETGKSHHIKGKYDTKGIIHEAKKKIFDFDYRIMSCEISGNRANVMAEITSYDLGKAFREWYIDSNQVKFSGEDSSGSKNIDLRLKLLEQKFKESTKTYKSVFEIHLTKKHGDWVVSDMGNSYEFLRAVSGTFIYN